MCLALVVVKEHAWRAVQLRNDYALGTIDDKGTVIGHQRHFTEIDLLFAYFFNWLRRAAGFLVINNKTHQHTNRSRKGQTAHLTFFNVKYWLAKAVAHIFKCRVA